MAWIYLAESEEYPWHSTSGSKQFATAKETDIANPLLQVVSGQVNLRTLQFGTILEPLLPPHSERQRQSTFYQAASHARTSVLQEMEKVWQESEVDFSLRSLDLSKNWDQNSSSWKTSQLSLLGEEHRLLTNLPSSGMIVGGQWYQPQNLEPHILEEDGSYLPTPTANEGGRNKSASKGARIRPSLGMMAKKNQWPTPNARDWKGPTGPNWNHETLPDKVGGQLNPMWVEWLMGFPSEWTELKDWAMQWFRSKQKQHLKD